MSVFKGKKTVKNSTCIGQLSSLFFILYSSSLLTLPLPVDFLPLSMCFVIKLNHC